MNRLKQLRKGNMLTLKELARATGISAQSLSGYERGVNQPTADRLIWLADYFNVTVDYLLEMEER